jgi:hypothetical protein
MGASVCEERAIEDLDNRCSDVLEIDIGCVFYIEVCAADILIDALVELVRAALLRDFVF